jgi:ATP-dependent DNA helicase PIF1
MDLSAFAYKGADLTQRADPVAHAAVDNLCPDQQIALDFFLSGRNLFISGAGGTGKTFLIQRLKSMGNTKGRKVAVCAMTGTAAQLIDGTTLHRWAGIGLGTPEALQRATKNTAAVGRWRETEVLILDEVSMLDAALFDELDVLGRRIKRFPDAPFGGLQLVFCGDFCQLPPIGKAAKFCFESPRWEAIFPHTVQLTTMHRQKENLSFGAVLNEIREGRVSPESRALLEARMRLDPPPDVTRIVPTRFKAETINKSEYAALTTLEHVFTTADTLPKFPSVEDVSELEKLKDRFVGVLRLKVGTVVMSTFNLDEHVCNGSQGVVQGFSGNGLPVVRFNKGFSRTLSRISVSSETRRGVAVQQIPLMYAWAITIHKSQGISLDVAEIDIGGDVFEDGQAYVALSRLRSLDGLFLSNFDPSRIKMNQKVRTFYLK